MRFDVIVLGAGPVGSYTALCLADIGLKVALVDRKELPGKEVCSGVLGEEAFDRFSLPENSVEALIKTIRINSPKGGCSISYSSQGLARVVDRRVFDRELLSRAVSKGARFFGGVRVKSLEVARREVRLSIGDVLAGEVLVVASGFSPSLLRSLGFGEYKGVYEGSQVMAEMSCSLSSTEVFVGNRFKGGFGWIIPLENGSSKVGVVSRESSREVLRGFLSFLREKGFISGWDGIRTAPIPSRPIDRMYSYRVLVVGEAAGQVKATTFGGVYYGLISSKLCASVLKEAFEKGRFDGGILGSYQRIWNEKMGREVEMGIRFREKVEAMDDSSLENLMNRISSSKVFSLLKGLVKFDWHSPIIKFLLDRGLIV